MISYRLSRSALHIILIIAIVIFSFPKNLVEAKEKFEIKKVKPVEEYSLHSVSSDQENLLRMNIQSNPSSIDPTFWYYGIDSMMMVEQLFAGLVDWNDETSEVEPDLAVSWVVSSDNTVYDFTLRDDAYWSNGTKITAEDFRYSILRSLNPVTGCEYAFILAPILNAEEFTAGVITDPDLVGVETISDTQLRITLEYPASEILSILAMWTTRPLPVDIVETWGGDWTNPEHIVTSGPYMISEWIQDDHILLEKNPSYFNAEQVQIDSIYFTMVDPLTAWNMYLDGNLDTVEVPDGIIPDDAVLDEISSHSTGAIDYLGINTALPPFDNALIRKALSAAIDRQALVSVLGFGIPAITFTPPGVMGYVDGVSEGIGIPYNPLQAQSWLTEAGYPAGVGLPPVTLWYNTSVLRQTIAEFVHDQWLANLGVDVELQALDWAEYRPRVTNGEFQIFRWGWSYDYPDAKDFLDNGLMSIENGLGGWNNALFWDAIEHSSSVLDSTSRLLYFQQAEEILLEEDAVVIPLYHYDQQIATKPYLNRNFGVVFSPDLSNWSTEFVQTEIAANTGGTIVSEDEKLLIEVPPFTFAEDVKLNTYPGGVASSGSLEGVGNAYNIEAFDLNDDPVDFQPDKNATITFNYTTEEILEIEESSLALYYWDGTEWIKDLSSNVNIFENTVTATVDHFSNWALIGEAVIADAACLNVAEIPIKECNALVALYNSTDGDNWTDKTNWLQTDTPSNWFGLGVSNGFVQYIRLEHNNLTGTIPVEIGQFQQLEMLELGINQISGQIPEEIGQLSSITWFSLADNNLEGALPAELWNLANLTIIAIQKNNFSGEIPTTLGNLENLITLNLSVNQFSGVLPEEFWSLTNLIEINLYNNQFTGSISQNIGQLVNLNHFNISNNLFSGSIPKEIGNLTNLGGFYLNDNMFTGEIPPEIGLLTNLKRLYLFNNQLSGSIPSEIGQLTNLEYLYLYNNTQISGQIPKEIGQLTKLKHFGLWSSQLSGSIPPDIGQLTNLEYLALMGNQLTGNIPIELGQLDKLIYLYLNNNQLNGSIPHEIGGMTSIKNLTLGANNLSGELPSEIGLLANLENLRLENNLLSGDIPFELSDLTNLANLAPSFGLKLDYNRFNVPDPYPSDPPTELETFLMQKNPDWYLTQAVSEEIDNTGGVITANDDQTTITIPPAAVSETVTLSFIPQAAPRQSTGSLSFVSTSFFLEAVDDTGTPLETFSFESPVTISLSYGDEDLVEIREDTILLYYWDTLEQLWKDAAASCTPQSTYTRDMVNNTLSVEICHFTEFSLLGEDYIKLFLPLTLR